MLLYLDNLTKGLVEVERVLKSNSSFICSTYSESHKKEIDGLVRTFDSFICLSRNNLYDVFCKENGYDILKPFFISIEWFQYEDSLYVDNADALIVYIVSCHINQNEILLPRYQEFRNFVIMKIGDGLKITKDAVIYIYKKQETLEEAVTK